MGTNYYLHIGKRSVTRDGLEFTFAVPLGALANGTLLDGVRVKSSDPKDDMTLRELKQLISECAKRDTEFIGQWFS